MRKEASSRALLLYLVFHINSPSKQENNDVLAIVSALGLRLRARVRAVITGREFDCEELAIRGGVDRFDLPNPRCGLLNFRLSYYVYIANSVRDMYADA